MYIHALIALLTMISMALGIGGWYDREGEEEEEDDEDEFLPYDMQDDQEDLRTVPKPKYLRKLLECKCTMSWV